MIHILSCLTLLSLLVPIYVYLLYPLLLFVLVRIKKSRPPIHAVVEPSVTLIVSCYNEEAVLPDKIRNCFELDYPTEKLEFLFVSDASTDNTDAIIRASRDESLRLVRQAKRLGKTLGLNRAVPEAKGAIIVFSDANAMYQPNALRKLVRHFADDTVGYVVGAALYRDSVRTTAGDSEDRYWRYEIAIKELESRLHSVVGGDGAIYAIRKELYEPLDREDISDFVNPLQIIGKGFRGIFDSEAISYESTAGDFSREAHRKRRIVNRSFTALLKNSRLLNPFRFGFFSFQLFSHKVLRWLIPVFLFVAAIGVLVLAVLGLQKYQLLLLLGIAFIWAVVFGNVVSRVSWIPGMLLIPYYFWVVNYNAILGILDALRGRVQVTWSTPRTASRAIGRFSFLKAVFLSLVLSGSGILFYFTWRTVGEPLV